MRLSDVTLNLEEIDEGVWKDVPGDEDKLRLLVRGRRSDAYQRAQKKAMRTLRRSLGRNQSALLEQVTRIDDECVAKHCLLGWENFLDAKGKQIPFTQEFALTLMTDRRYEPFKELVKEMIDDVDNGYEEVADDVVEKS